MIVRWRSRGPLESVAEWQGIQLTLSWELLEHKWSVRVDGVRCRQRWVSQPVAKDAIDVVIERLVTEAARTAHAVQRPLTPRPPVGVFYGA